MQFILEGPQTRKLQLYDSRNLFSVSSQDLPLELATQTEQMDTSSIAGSSILYLNRNAKRNGGDTHISSSCSWSGLPLAQDELPVCVRGKLLRHSDSNRMPLHFCRRRRPRTNQRFLLEQQAPYQQESVQEHRAPSRLFYRSLPYCQQ